MQAFFNTCVCLCGKGKTIVRGRPLAAADAVHVEGQFKIHTESVEYVQNKN